MDLFLTVLKIFFWGIISFFLSILIFPLIVKFIEIINARKEILKYNSPIFQSLHSKKSGTPTMGGIIFWLIPICAILIIYILSYFNNDFSNWLNFLSRRETYLPLGFLILGGLMGALDDLMGIFFLKKTRFIYKRKTNYLFCFFNNNCLVVYS
ncbi:MAG: hypothetical protein KatS3mg095_0765 [Candidatus Parcubacteria bacterium]|nr:MAG: hypothetical protein KatS3mg095_0765 [Candidatus Parcubacteria bacterium]